MCTLLWRAWASLWPWPIRSKRPKGQKLLNKPISLLFSTPARWLFWMPISASTLNLTQVADTACQAACEALAAWCDFIEHGTPGKDEEAAKALWQTQNLYCHLFEAAGLV